MIGFLRANPAVAGMAMLTTIATLVLGAIGIYMSRAGMSLRPIVFMAVFFGIVIGPQFAFHLAQALGAIPKRELAWTFGKDRPHPGWTEQEAALRAEDGRFADPASVFGPNVDRDLVTDLRRAGPDLPFGSAEVAAMGIIPPTSSAMVARYADHAAAERAAAQYLMMAAGVVPPRGADGTMTVTRPQGDVAKAVVAGRTLVVLTGPDDAALAERLRSSRVVSPVPQTAFVPTETATPEARDFWLYRPPVLIASVLALVVIASLWFFRGAAWAATVAAREGVAPQPSDALRQQLLGVGALDVPLDVREQSDGRIAVTWRFADAKWVDLARAHGMRRTHRILLELDERSRTVYPTEQQSRLDWSAGANGGGVEWSTMMGIVFFQVEHQRVFGLQLDERGRFVPKVSYAYTFNLQEMKAPLISAVTEAGWQWRPTLWQGPAWMRWLTH